MTEVIKDVLPGRPAAALTGPDVAREIRAGQLGIGCPAHAGELHRQVAAHQVGEPRGQQPLSR